MHSINFLNRRDNFLSFIVFSQLIIVALQQLLPLIGFPVEKVAVYRIMVTLFTFIPGVLMIFTTHLNKILVVFFCYFFILFVNYLFFPESRPFIESKEAITLTPISLLTILFVSSINNKRFFFKVLLLVSRISLVVSFVYVIIHSVSPLRELNNTYSMSFGYSMLLPAMFLFTQNTFKDKIYSLVLFALILLAGSRGPVIVLVLFYLYCSIFTTSFRTKIKLIPLLVISVLLLMIILPKFEIFETSRTMAVLNTSGDLIGYDSGREDELYSVIRPRIFERPITGWGIGSDRYFLDGLYCHNIFLEIYMHYGIVFGSIIMIVFALSVIKVYMSKKLMVNKDNRLMFVMFFMYGCIPLLVSGSYISTYNFAVFIGYFFLLKRRCHNLSIRIKTDY